ncbi:hypothetical protein [Halobaculum sp. EA56]|uniref:hypothetical protein n=1 Tax=Halobaculum sp. EA56 TaxID=3421648 RepID=UPI003EBE5CB0
MRLETVTSGLASICLIIVSVILIFIPPASGYEPSIYTSYPSWMWIIYAIGILCSFGMVFVNLSGSKIKHPLDRGGARDYVIKGFVLLLSFYVILFFLPIYRGYHLYGRGSLDILFHLGLVKGIIQTGSLSGNNWYPILHVFLSVLRIFGVSEPFAVSLTQIVFFLLFSLGTGIYSRQYISENKSHTVSVLAFPLMFGIFHSGLHPAIYSFFLFPLLAHLLDTVDRRANWALIPLATSIVFFHPITAILTFGYGIFSKVYENTIFRDITNVSAMISLAGLVLSFIWYFNFSRVENIIAKTAIPLISRTSVVGQQSEAARSTSLSAIHFLVELIRLYGAYLSYVLIGVIVFGTLILHYYRSRNLKSKKLLLLFLATAAVIILFLSASLVTNPIRVGRWAIFVAIVGTGYIINQIDRIPLQTVMTYTVIGLVLIAAVVGPFSIYQDGNHMTESEYDSAEWIVSMTSPEPVISHAMGYKMIIYISGPSPNEERYRQFRKADPNFQLPNHLGYMGSGEPVTDIFAEKYYIYLKTHDIKYKNAYYEEQQPSLTSYTKQDVQYLNTDTKASKIYTNGGASTYYVGSPSITTRKVSGKLLEEPN